MKKLVFLTALFLMFFVVTTAHALTCEEKLTQANNKGKFDNLSDCVSLGEKACRSTPKEGILIICQSFGLTHEQSWSDVVVDRVAIEQRVLKQIRERAEKTKVRNNRTYY